MKALVCVAFALAVSAPAVGSAQILPPSSDPSRMAVTEQPAVEPDAVAETPSQKPEAKSPPRDRDRLGWAVPDYFKLQTGGYVGVVNVRAGYAIFDDILNLGAGYGFAPTKGEVPASHSVDFELAVRPLELPLGQIRIVPLYLAAGLVYVIGDHFKARYPDRYTRIDPNYYPPTALHWTLGLGAQVGLAPLRGFVEKHSLYYQLTTLDTFATSFVDNTKTISFFDVVSSTAGYRIDF